MPGTHLVPTDRVREVQFVCVCGGGENTQGIFDVVCISVGALQNNFNVSQSLKFARI